MLSYVLAASLCTTAAQDDCRPVREYGAYFEEDAGIRCELDRMALLDGQRGMPPVSRLIRLECEPRFIED